MSCCICYLWDWQCLKRAADIPETTQVDFLLHPYSMAYYELEQKIGRECLEELCANKAEYEEVLDELLPYFAITLSINYKIRNMDINYPFSNGVRTDDNIDQAMQSPAMQALLSQSKILWQRFETWLKKNSDKYPSVCSCCFFLCSKPKQNISNFYRGRNFDIR